MPRSVTKSHCYYLRAAGIHRSYKLSHSKTALVEFIKENRQIPADFSQRLQAKFEV